MSDHFRFLGLRWIVALGLVACGGGNDGSAALPAPAAEVQRVKALGASSGADAAALVNQAVNLQDAIAILKLIVGLDVNAPGQAVTAYQSYAADFDGNGKVELTDAIGVLKRIVGLDAPSPAWLFFNQPGNPITLSDKLNPGTPPALAADIAGTSATNVALVAVLRGDVVGSSLSYAWTLGLKPTGSNATLKSAAAPVFTADLPGTYEATMTVTDGSANSSSATLTATLTARVSNIAPVANAGSAQNVTVGAQVVLDGSASSDANGDALSYAWTLSSKPNTSSAVISAGNSAKAAFTADVAGTYVLSLTVHDGQASSPAATITVSAAASTGGTGTCPTSTVSCPPASLKTLAAFPLGAAVANTDLQAYNILTVAAEQQLVEKHFNQMTASNIMKFKYLHPNNDTRSVNDFTFEKADAFVSYGDSKSINIHGHALVWHSSYQVPDFVKNWSSAGGTSDQFLTMLDTHVSTIVNHFKGKANVVSWDVVNEALTDGNPSVFRTDSDFYIQSGNSNVYIERAFKAARLANANVDLYYNDYNIERNGAKMTALDAMLTDFQKRSIPLTGVGFQMHVCLNTPSVTAIAAALKRVAAKGLKVKITELDVAINNPNCDSFPANKVSSFTQAAGLAQKKRYCEIVTAYLDNVPAGQRGGITVWGTTDGHSWLDSNYATEFDNQKLAWPLLFDAQYQSKPALTGFADALTGKTCNDAP